jgi:hypothetical protein
VGTTERHGETSGAVHCSNNILLLSLGISASSPWLTKHKFCVLGGGGGRYVSSCVLELKSKKYTAIVTMLTNCECG